MCSARLVPSPDDITARARIREVALRLFADSGFDRTSLRAIAREAGVSPALVIHHFGSKEGLRQAVDDAVVEAISEIIAAGTPGSPTDTMIDNMGRRTREIFGEQPVLWQYIRRLLFEGGDAASVFFNRILDLGREYVDELVEQGYLRPAPDEEFRVLFMFLLDLGLIMLQPLVEQRLGESLLTEQMLERWLTAEIDFQTYGIFSDRARPEIERRYGIQKAEDT